MATTLYIVARKDGAFKLGCGTALQIAKALVDVEGANIVLRSEPLKPSTARLGFETVQRSLTRRGFRKSKDGWWPLAARPLAVDCCNDFFHSLEIPNVDRNAAEIMTALRENVFQTSQWTMAQICGVSASQVSRFEAGLNHPNWQELANIREFARQTGVPWSDDFLFRPVRPGELKKLNSKGTADGKKEKIDGNRNAGGDSRRSETASR